MPPHFPGGTHPGGEPPSWHSDRLMAHGVTFGGALAVHLGRVIPNNSVSQDTLTASFMPYVLLSPAYWGSSIGALCAAHNAAPDEVVERLRERYHAGSPRSECLWHKLGIYVGKPFSYDATTTVAKATPTQRVRDVRTLLSTGLAFSPSSFYTLALGLTFAEVTREDLSSATLVVPTVSIGVNADVIRLLLLGSAGAPSTSSEAGKMREREFFAPGFRERVGAAVARVELQTGAEVVVCVRPRCATYEGARHLAGALFSFMALLVLLFHPIEFSVKAMPSAVALLYVLGYWVAGRSPRMLRWFTPRRVREGQVSLAARAAFLELGVTETRRRVGVLVFVSLLERRVELLGDRGLPPDLLGEPWAQAAEALRATLARGPQPDAFLAGVEALGPVLARAAPRHEDDENELPDMPAPPSDAEVP
jgi:putative membrane protein